MLNERINCFLQEKLQKAKRNEVGCPCLDSKGEVCSVAREVQLKFAKFLELATINQLIISSHQER